MILKKKAVRCCYPHTVPLDSGEKNGTTRKHSIKKYMLGPEFSDHLMDWENLYQLKAPKILFIKLKIIREIGKIIIL